jgi:hypothetical protein
MILLMIIINVDNMLMKIKLRKMIIWMKIIFSEKIILLVIIISIIKKEKKKKRKKKKEKEIKIKIMKKLIIYI